MPIRPDKAAAKLTPYVHGLLEGAQLGAEGQVTWEVTGQYVMSSAVLVGSLKHLPHMPDDEMLLRKCTRQALVALKRAGNDQPSWDEFVGALNSEIASENAEVRTKRLVLFFLHLRGPWIAHKRSLGVLGMQFRVRTWAQMQRLRECKEFLDDAQHNYRTGRLALSDLSRKFVPLVVEVHSRTADEAIRLAERRFEVLRASLNLVRSYGTRTRQFGRPRPLAQCLPPPVYGVFSEDGAYEGMYLSESLHEYPRPKAFTIEEGRAVERLTRQVDRLPDEKVRYLLVDLLLKYGQALDTTDWRSAFLALWQILEVASLRTAHRELRVEDIRKRVLTLARYKPVIEDLLDLLIEDRHALVHEGTFSTDGLEWVNHLKSIAEHTILGLLDKARKFRDLQSLEEFYRQAPVPEQALRLRRHVIKEILRTP